MDNITVIADDWIRSLRTLDTIRSQIYIESIYESFQNFNPKDKRSLIITFLNNIQTEKSEPYIKNYISCLSCLNQKADVSESYLLEKSSNPLISKYLLESIIKRSTNSPETVQRIITQCISEPFSKLFSYSIHLIIQANFSEFVSTLKKFYMDHKSMLLDYFLIPNPPYTEKYKILTENLYVLLKSLNHFDVLDDHLIDSNKHLLSILCDKKTQLAINPQKSNLSKLISQLFYNISIPGQHIQFLLTQFRMIPSESIKISIIHKFSKFPKDRDSQYIIALLQEIAEEDNYFVFSVASMVKIGGEGVKSYVLKELQSDRFRRIFFTTYFIPYLDIPTDKFNSILDDLLQYKQPLILKQALWVIRKKKSSEYITQVIKLLFHDNAQVRGEAKKVLLEVPNSIEYLSRNINYYGPEKQAVISGIIAKLRKLNG
ncbi:MAG: hypothetical protein JW776_05405 [Candidatus Lokiarchaeota archaeon]|nr:hypothetical protein [Candidatus Lokiarchaeota archaeon]